MQWQWLAADSSSSPPSFLPPHSPLYTRHPTRRRVRAAVELGGLSGQMDSSSRAALFCFLAVASSLLHPARSDGKSRRCSSFLSLAAAFVIRFSSSAGSDPRGGSCNLTA